MKSISFIPIAAALLMSLPLAAQTTVTTPPTPPAPPQQPGSQSGTISVTPDTHVEQTYEYEIETTVPDVPEVPDVPAPPTAPRAPRAPHAPKPPKPPHIRGNAKTDEDIVIETPLELGDLDSNDIVVDSPQSVNRIQIDSLGNILKIRITKSEQQCDQLRQHIDMLRKDLNQKTRQLKRIKIVIDKDTTGLEQALNEARTALDSAHMSVIRLDSSIISIRSNGHGPMAAFDTRNFMSMMDADSNALNMQWMPDSAASLFARQFSYEFSDTSDGHGKHVIIMKSFTDADGDSVAGVPFNAPFSAMGRNGSNMAMLFSDDSAGTVRSMAFSNGNMATFSRSNGKVPCGISIQHSSDSNGLVHSQSIVIRSFGSDSLPAISHTDIRLGKSPFVVLNNRIVIGHDSLRIVDGKDQQMVIRVDSMSANGRTHVIIITTSRIKSANAMPPTEQPANLMKNTMSATSGYALEANTPNPFPESTTITFTLPKPEHATLTVFDANGAMVKVLKDEELPAGTHTATFDASGLASGVYLYRLVAGGFSETKTMTVAK